MGNLSIVHPTVFRYMAGLFVLDIFFLGASALYYKKNSLKKEKTSRDYVIRKRCIDCFTFLFCITIPLIPFLINACGYPIMGELSSRYTTSVSNITEFFSHAFFLPVLISLYVLYADNLLYRVAKPIYTKNDVPLFETFCLYLRPFGTDNNKEEKLVCRKASDYYPIYAIGDPMKALQPNGANRLYLEDDSWKKVVDDMSVRSRFILLRVGNTDGTIWELDNIIKKDLINKVIFLTYKESDYEYLRIILYEKKNIKFPIRNNSHNVHAYFLTSDEIQYKDYPIKTKEDVGVLLDDFLIYHQDLNTEVYNEAESITAFLKYNPLSFMSYREYIPKKIKRSFRWSSISPIVSWRHWPISVWIYFFIIVIISKFLNTSIPINLFVLLSFFWGNQIEWAVNPDSGPVVFLRKQRREALIVWLILLVVYLYAFLYLYLYVTGDMIS